jgi:pyruvate/2-oxoglutarate/acetoin dehydrogenase E1 component
MRGLQEKYGPLRISDTGIRETTIIGQAIGMAMRGLRPIAEIQYLDYLLYALQIMSDDLATLHWRTKGGQIAPVIVRTRGHRLEGIWHSGSLMAGIIHLLRGIHVLVPRNMTQAAGFYKLAAFGRPRFAGRSFEWLPAERAASG